MNQIASTADIIAELKQRGYEAKLDGSIITFDINPDTGICRSYTVEHVADKWQVNLSEVIFKGDEKDNEEQTDLGSFSSATEIANAIDEEENG
jgi:hypothetical protein